MGVAPRCYIRMLEGREGEKVGERGGRRSRAM